MGATTTSGIDQAIRAAGSQQKLAVKLGVTQQMVSKYKRNGFVPADRAVEIEVQFGVPRSTLINPRLLDLVGEGGE